MRVAVVGATGVVGSTILEVMRERSFPADEVVPFASERSAGKKYGDVTKWLEGEPPDPATAPSKSRMRSVCVCSPSLRIRLARCLSTVRSLRCNWEPISGQVFPSAASWNTCRSRGVSNA